MTDSAVAPMAAGSAAENVAAKFKAIHSAEFPELRTYSSHTEMLANEQLDLLTVATSDHRHADIVVDAANAGVRGIFCEPSWAR
jgi:predicted dehydrogenase